MKRILLERAETISHTVVDLSPEERRIELDALRSRDAEHTFRRLPRLGGQFGIEYRREAGLTDSQLAHLREEAAIVRVTLDDSAGFS